MLKIVIEDDINMEDSSDIIFIYQHGESPLRITGF